MFTKSLQIGFILLGSAFLMGNLGAATPTIQGDVRGPDGKPLAGAEVRVQLKVALGTYKVIESKNGVAATATDNIRTRAEGAVRVDFDLKKQTGEAKASAPAKKAKHMVWVPADTGSHLGGKWVEVDDQGKGAAGANIDRSSGEAMRKKTSLTPDSTPGGP